MNNLADFIVMKPVLVTHYLEGEFDDTGQPQAVDPSGYDGGNDPRLRPLPEGWVDDDWDWRPFGDPNGQWVELVDENRDILWEEVKAERARAEFDLAPVTIGGVEYLVQVDAESRERIRMMKELADADPEGFSTDWRMADNQEITVDHAGMEAIALAPAALMQALHVWSQGVKQQLYDPAKTTLAELRAVDRTWSVT